MSLCWVHLFEIDHLTLIAGVKMWPLPCAANWLYFYTLHETGGCAYTHSSKQRCFRQLAAVPHLLGF